MTEASPQSYANHRRFVPSYHFVAFGLLAVYALWSLYRLVTAFSADTLFAFLFAVAVLLLFFHARIFPLTVQDRVIRLEMQLRLERLLPAELRPRIDELRRGQLIALRFAGDAELPELTRKVLEEGITDREAIKKLIKVWRPDHLRA